jgi:hypothetical protein
MPKFRHRGTLVQKFGPETSRNGWWGAAPAAFGRWLRTQHKCLLPVAIPTARHGEPRPGCAIQSRTWSYFQRHYWVTDGSSRSAVLWPCTRWLWFARGVARIGRFFGEPRPTKNWVTSQQISSRASVVSVAPSSQPFQTGSLAAVAVDFYRITQYFMG